MTDAIEKALELGENEQGAFMSDEVADMLKDGEVSKAFYEHIDECSMCGHMWPIDSMEESGYGLYCHYCIQDVENED